MSSKINSLIFGILLAVSIIPLVSADNGNVTLNTTPFITIDPIGNQTIDNVFFINGTTNLPASNDSLLIQIETADFNPAGWGSDYRSNVSIQPGENGVNLWSCNVTTDRWVTFPGPEPDAVPGEYVVMVASISSVENAEAQSVFLLSSENKIPPSYKPPVASFAFSGNRTIEPYDMAPLAVQFTDTSANSPNLWLWSFGDGGTSSSTEPVTHLYECRYLHGNAYGNKCGGQQHDNHEVRDYYYGEQCIRNNHIGVS